MKILVLNCGSSSLKFALIELPTYKVLTSGNEERVGIADPFITFRKPDGKKEERHLHVSAGQPVGEPQRRSLRAALPGVAEQEGDAQRLPRGALEGNLSTMQNH